MKNRGGSQPWRNPQKSLSDKVANHSPACPDSELECLGDMQIIKPNKVLQLLRRKVWPNKMHFSQWQKFSHSTSEIFIHKTQLHVAHNRRTALSPCVQVGKLSYFKIREKNNKHSAAFIFGFCFHQFFFFFFVGLSQTRIKNSLRIQKILLKRRLKSHTSWVWAVTKGFWTVVWCFRHSLWLSPIAVSLLPLSFNSTDIPKWQFLSKRQVSEQMSSRAEELPV